jgi:hypothetical protein
MRSHGLQAEHRITVVTSTLQPKANIIEAMGVNCLLVSRDVECSTL